MKSLLLKYLGVSFLIIPYTVCAETEDKDYDIEILAQRGKAQVTQTDFAARANKIPAKARHATLRNGSRFQNVLSTLLLQAQLAADAREAGFDQEKIVMDRMRLAADVELADAWLQHYVEMQPEANYDQLAREYYQLHKQDMMSPREMDVSHILISTENRSDEDAGKLAASISKQLDENPLVFDELVMTYSEDPSSNSNQGKFYRVKSGDMVKPFEDAAFSLSKGVISKPVKTRYGFHIIRLDETYEPRMLSFDDVKLRLVDRERGRHEERIKKDYISSLSALDLKMSEAALQEMVRRQFGEDYVESPDGGAESE